MKSVVIADSKDRVCKMSPLSSSRVNLNRLLLLARASPPPQLSSTLYKALSCSEGFQYLTHDLFGKMWKAAENGGYLLGKPATKPADISHHSSSITYDSAYLH